MAHLLRMPEVAADSAEAVLQEWSVPENQTFSATDTLATIETEKAVVEVEAESAGVIVRALVAAGARVAVGAPIAVVAEPGEAVTDLDGLLRKLGVSNGEAPAGTDTALRTAGVGEGTESSEPAASEQLTRAVDAAGTRLFISPLARRLAGEAGLDPTAVVGTGPNGRIRKRDVEAALAATADPVGGSTVPQGPALPGVSRPPEARSDGRERRDRGGYSEVPHSRLRRAVASRLSHSKQTVPHFYVRGTADVGALVALRREINDQASAKVSFNDLMLKAVAVAHQRHPDMNVTWTDDAVRRYDHVDLSVAIASERGLVTPVLRGVETMTVTQIAGSVRDFVERADAGKLKQDELEGGSFSLSNLGMFGTEEFSAIINPPQAAILSVGAIREEPVVRDGEIAVGRVVHVVLSVDHRPVDGAVAADWMRTFLAVLESPLSILL
ncbi:MAG: dihydrolipoamide acetyltransferase family protein [Nocardioides sp.]